MKHVHIRGIVVGGTTITKRIEMEAEQEINLEALVPASATDEDYDLEIDVSALKSLVIVADGDLTLETNSSSAPANTFSIVANIPFMWRDGDGTLRDTGGTSVSSDITELFVTNGNDREVKLQVFTLLDPTA